MRKKKDYWFPLLLLVLAVGGMVLWTINALLDAHEVLP